LFLILIIIGSEYLATILSMYLIHCLTCIQAISSISTRRNQIFWGCTNFGRTTSLVCRVTHSL